MSLTFAVLALLLCVAELTNSGFFVDGLFLAYLVKVCFSVDPVCRSMEP
jgi:hypothetical protein